jgi:predicted CXXCH cytochrome family protein
MKIWIWALFVAAFAASGFSRIFGGTEQVRLKPDATGISQVRLKPDATHIGQVRLKPDATDNNYVGAAACESCHRQIHGTWTVGRHSKMLQPATTAAVKGDFARGSITLRNHRYGLRADNGQYYITESELTGKPQEHRIDYTLGSRRVQHYLTTLDKGRIVVLAPSWDVERRQWFHNVEIIRPDEDDRQIVQQWNKSCVGCHVSRQDNNYDPATHAYRTEWADFGTSCERCHGPGRAHIQKYSESTQSAPGQQNAANSAVRQGVSPALIVKPTRLDPNTGSMVCAQCHSLRTAINPGYKAGDDYYDFFVPTLEYAPYVRPHASQDPAYWADGRPRRFSNDAIGLWESQCFLRGGATCTTCHTNPHLPDIEQNPQLTSARSNALCTRCHEAIGSRLTAHTRHAPASAGSACVECHMPKTVVSIKATMRDHTIGVPAPENTVRFNIPNACTECHTDKTAAWAVDTLETWWPRGTRGRLVAQAEAFSAARAGRTDAVDGLIAIADDEQRPPLVRANAVGYLGRFADPRAVAAVVRAAASPHPAIRAIAIAALREAGRADRTGRTAVLGALTDPKRAVRIAALMTLVEQGGADLTAGDLARFRYVADEFTQWTGVNQNDPELQRAQGVVQLLKGDADRAADALAISYDLEPQAPTVRFFLAIARLGQRRIDDARTLLRDIPNTDPFYEQAQEQLRRLPQ